MRGGFEGMKEGEKMDVERLGGVGEYEGEERDS